MAKRALLAALCVLPFLTAPLGAAQYKVSIKRLDANVFQAQASKVIIETRLCEGWIPTGDSDTEEVVLNWEGTYGNNWILFTASRTRCDIATIR